MDLRLMILKKFGPQGSVCPHPGAILYSYFMLQVGTCTEGKMFLHYCLFKHEITVLLPNYTYSRVTYHVTRL